MCRVCPALPTRFGLPPVLLPPRVARVPYSNPVLVSWFELVCSDARQQRMGCLSCPCLALFPLLSPTAAAASLAPARFCQPTNQQQTHQQAAEQQHTATTLTRTLLTSARPTASADSKSSVVRSSACSHCAAAPTRTLSLIPLAHCRHSAKKTKRRNHQRRGYTLQQ